MGSSSRGEPDDDRARIDHARARVSPARPSTPLECWVHIKLPESREGWRRALAAYEQAGATASSSRSTRGWSISCAAPTRRTTAPT